MSLDVPNSAQTSGDCLNFWETAGATFTEDPSHQRSLLVDGSAVDHYSAFFLHMDERSTVFGARAVNGRAAIAQYKLEFMQQTKFAKIQLHTLREAKSNQRRKERYKR